MISIISHIATPVVDACTPALLQVSSSGAPVSGRRMAAGLVVGYDADVLAFPNKGALLGVRAWSPPV